ncbi:protein arginine kinase [Proteiniclasticum sp. BAD-10]|uniref:Protein arginine kinase n=1 Tax=Proteiniclasticum sediminis TaxID=2804028 RepID=A0A941HR88_9CLOT|nr:protein arginine kinase [Proteiniclasticum sediminis]MBR0576343.1 protein arginine kinase [Proteiniclasticum sediminis]
MLSKETLVLKSRIRLARNFKSIPFPHMLESERARQLVNAVEDAFYVSKAMEEAYETHRLWEMGRTDLLVAFEKHLVSAKLLNNSDMAAFILDKEEDVSLMINEEDHLRLQVMGKDMNLEELYDKASRIDDLLSEKLNFAYDHNLGYITACPTNLGTALRASVMLHLPGFTLTDKIGYVSQALAQMGMTIRGIYGEGSQAEGNIYQISNEVTLGMTEDDIVYNLKDTIMKLLDEEQEHQKKLLGHYTLEMEDKIYRSMGTLMNARLMTSKEALHHLSLVRMGIETELIRDVDIHLIDGLIINTQPGMMKKAYGADLTDRERDINRAKIIRSIF